jgi:hypothetical protein
LIFLKNKEFVATDTIDELNANKYYVIFKMGLNLKIIKLTEQILKTI